MCNNRFSRLGLYKSPLKSTAYVLNQLAVCRSNNTNLLLNFGPTKEGEFSNEMVSRLNEIAAWMKVNEVAISGTSVLGKGEEASVPAVAKEQHRYLFVIPTMKGINPPVLPLNAVTITLKTPHPIKSIKMLGKDTKINYEVNSGTITIHVPAEIRSVNGDLLDIKLK